MTPITHLDLSGFEQLDQLVWRDARGTILSLHFFDLVPDLPAPLHEPQALAYHLAHRTARAGAGLIEATIEPLDTAQALRQLIKVPHPQGHGQVFIGSYTVPKATCSTVLKLQAPELGTTGMREAAVMSQLGPAKYFTPSPFAPDLQGGLPFHWADHEHYDAQFPDHPLALIRATLRRLVPGVRLDERFKALPPFGGPQR